jgi:hypothetical protein
VVKLLFGGKAVFISGEIAFGGKAIGSRHGDAERRFLAQTGIFENKPNWLTRL